MTLGLGTGYSREQDEEDQRSRAVAFMRSQIGKGYSLGVEVKPGDEEDSPLWDCSEFTEAASRQAGWSPVLPDGAWQQYDVCRPVDHPRAGDLGFLWSDKRGMIGHVMMATGHGTVIHAVIERGVVEDPAEMWSSHPRWRGWRRHPGFSRDGDAQA
jgi:cell wall-associated NlpC family hydrolase